jgi:hypothetical protein
MLSMIGAAPAAAEEEEEEEEEEEAEAEAEEEEEAPALPPPALLLAAAVRIADSSLGVAMRSRLPKNHEEGSAACATRALRGLVSCVCPASISALSRRRLSVAAMCPVPCHVYWFLVRRDTMSSASRMLVTS